MNKFRLWLLAHGIEFEGGEAAMGATPRFGDVSRHFCIAINHRFFGVDIQIVPFRGTFTDELDTPHKEIARQYEEQHA